MSLFYNHFEFGVDMDPIPAKEERRSLWDKSITTKMQFSYKFLAGKSVFHEEKKIFI